MMDETRMALFEECLIAECKESTDMEHGFAEGIFRAIKILGLADQYIAWSYGKTVKEKYVPYVGTTWVIVEGQEA